MTLRPWPTILKAKANEFARNVYPVIASIQARGITSLNAIAGELNARGIRDGSQWKLGRDPSRPDP